MARLFILGSKQVIMPSIGVLLYYYTTLHCMHQLKYFFSRTA